MVCRTRRPGSGSQKPAWPDRTGPAGPDLRDSFNVERLSGYYEDQLQAAASPATAHQDALPPLVAQNAADAQAAPSPGAIAQAATCDPEAEVRGATRGQRGHQR